MYAKNAWNKYESNEYQDVFSFSEDYRKFLSAYKTERECVNESVRLAEKNGFKSLDKLIKSKTQLKPKDKVYVVNKDKNVILFVIGNKPFEEGMRILGAHIDSPRLDIKQNPLYESNDFALLDTHYYGGIKKYQWVTLPLAIHGVVYRKDGSEIGLNIGEKEEDPVVGISDLLVHLSADQLQKKASVVIEGENLDITVGSIPLKDEEKDAVKANILKLLKERYNLEEEDFLSAELEVVPAGPARDYGLDRSMIMGYGHDDRVCAYTSLRAILDVEECEYTCCCILVDKEEIGSVGATGMQSKFFENVIAEMCALLNLDTDLSLRRTFTNSKMLSSDVSAGFDPLYANVNEAKNSAYLGKGVVFNKYTGSRGKGGCNDASPEFIAELRKIMDDNNIHFQSAELGKVDQGGGGTIAYILGNYNMEVIDCGVPVLNMHSPWEVASKVDIYEAYQAYKCFILAK
ncbi:aspartyl aminopeptidase [Breznakia sp. PF5-3]|uniref:aminopeptidase n=1 Tax=unclassified Breznakia TaxID=2623764 RepID=UPI002406F2D6|nr:MULTISPECIES: aminopeptidase [unclassified Breznakia]MDF9824405.1 aspartyl aminopeptidase [Breznakia sp. PM6-1]MDF9835134.1 aspartyl aminopeptidase [Breznakia sp. PF5-3]MDF9838217.1 aspartyl aminopeptidase [Breznakia sp. PFB2-8]MDF9860232.1 aspartyl aminopeptidase [Breznakia sp. PH5-24]